jgi:hypothetical protein
MRPKSSSIFAIVDDLPKDATELVTYGGVWADVPLVMIRAMKHGLTLPGAWGRAGGWPRERSAPPRRSHPPG